MATLTSSDSTDAILFPSTFISGGYIFPTPVYRYDVTDSYISYTLDQTRGSTGYYNINPTVRIFGVNLSVDSSGRASGTITAMEFRSSNRGEIARIEEISINASDFTDIIFARISGDNTSSTQFETLLAEALDVLEFGNRNQDISDRGMLQYLSFIDLQGGNDEFHLARPKTDGTRTIDGGAGQDTLHLDDFGVPDSFVVNLKTGQIITDSTSVNITGFEIIDGNPFVDRYIGSNNGDHIRAAGRADQINGFGGRDTLSGGWGDDRISGGRGKDRLYGDEGNDFLRGDAGADLLVGGAGRDRLVGRAGQDTLIADDGRDRLIGGAGSDLFVFNLSGSGSKIRDFDISEGDHFRLDTDGSYAFDTDSLQLTRSGFRINTIGSDSNVETLRVVLNDDARHDLSLDALWDVLTFG